jgi:hypothetical protein
VGAKRNENRGLVGNVEGRPRERKEDNIKMDIREIG